MSFFVALLVDGILAGVMYALIALAFVLIYKASSMINFALGEWMMFGALLSGFGATLLHLGTWPSLAFAGLGMAAFAAAFGAVVVRRLVARPALSAIMATLALGMVMRGVAHLLPAAAPPLVSQPAMGEPPTMLVDLAVAPEKLVAGAVSVLCVAIVALFYRHSRTGLALRAMADDPQVAASMGIDIDRHLLIVWGLTGAVAAIAGLLWVYVSGGGMGAAQIGLKVFPIVILGGLDSIPGTFVAAILIGVLESLSAGYLEQHLGSGFGAVVPSVVLLAVVILRPHGLLGSSRIERI
jgi:branched-chain amino acid transport system permease protein